MLGLGWYDYLAAEAIIDPEAPMSVDDDAWADWIAPLRVAVSAIAAGGPVPGDSSMRLAARVVLCVDANRAGDCLPAVSAGLIAAEAWPGAESPSMTFNEAVDDILRYADTIFRIADLGEAPAPGSAELRRIISDARHKYGEAMRGERYADAIHIIANLPHEQGTPGLIDDWLVGSRPEPPLSADDAGSAILRGAYPTQSHERIALQYREAIAELERCQRDAGLLTTHTRQETH